MVRAMDLAMTVRAAPVEKTARLWRIIRSVTGVTLGAEPRQAHFEQAVVNAAVGFVAIGAIIRNRRMFMQEGASPLRMAGEAVLGDAVLFELCRIGAAMRVVAIRTGNLSFFHWHVGRAHQLGLALQMALAADFGLGALVKKRGLVADLGKLIAVTGLFHDRVTIDAGDAAAGVGARLPVGLHASLVAAKAGLVLDLGRLSRVLAERDHPPDAFSSAPGNVVAARTVATLAGPLFSFVARVE